MLVLFSIKILNTFSPITISNSISMIFLFLSLKYKINENSPSTTLKAIKINHHVIINNDITYFNSKTLLVLIISIFPFFRTKISCENCQGECCPDSWCYPRSDVPKFFIN